ncbi:reverse transcriptase domain-containing protein [Tanacetum coccineum]
MVKRKRSPPMMQSQVANSKISLRARFVPPRAIISDRGSHFCNNQFAKVMKKYGVTHRLSTAYHPQTSGPLRTGRFSREKLKSRVEGTIHHHSSLSLRTVDYLQPTGRNCQSERIARIVKALRVSSSPFCLYDSLCFKSSASFWESRYPNLID